MELPPSGIPKKSVSSSKGVKLSSSTKQKTTESRRISSPQKTEKPLIVAKRTLDTKKIRPKVKRLSSTQLIDKAISKIEDRVKKEEQDKHVERAIQELEKKESNSDQEGSGGSGGSAIEGVSMSLYRADVKAYIRDNWSYPVALSDSAEPEAILLIKVENSGHIISYRFKKRSTDNTFNESVLKAIERSDPLPPFPEIFRKREEEIEVNFNLKDLQG